MLRNRKVYHKIIFILSILILFIISYLRFTYYINPNLSDEPWQIKMKNGVHGSENLWDLNEESSPEIRIGIKSRSIIVFWIFFGLTNYFLIRFWGDSEFDRIFYLITWFGLTFIILIFMGFHVILKPEQIFYGLFTKTKNFLLSPLYTGVVFIFVKFFNRIVDIE